MAAWVCGNQKDTGGVDYTPETLMRVLLRQFVLLCCAALFVTTWVHAQSGNEASHPAIFSLDPHQQKVISLVGLWRFKPGDDRRFAEVSYDDSAWALLRSDESWTRQGYETLTGFAWYRFRIVLPAGASHQSLLLPTLSSGYQCFLDGKLVHTEGAVTQQGVARYSMPSVIDLPSGERNSAQTHVVALRVWFDPRLDRSFEGGPNGTSVPVSSVGESASVKSRLSDFFALQRQDATVILDLSLLFILAGIMCIPLFLMERSNKEYFWYGIAATSFGLMLGIYFDQLTHGWPISTFLFVSSLFGWGTSAGLVLFFCYLLDIKRTWVTALVIIFSLAGAFCSSLENARLIGSRTSDLLSALGGCLFSAWVILVVARRARQRVLDARLLLVPVTIDFGILFLNSLRSEFPTAGTPIEALTQYVLLTYPFQIRVRNLSAVFVLLALVLVLLKRFARIRREHERITADMKAARLIQHLLIPDVLPTIPGLKIEFAYHPAQEVGGDFFQVIPVESGKTLIVLGDVSGKGLPAAMTVSLIVGVIRTLVDFTTSPGAILAGLNTRLVGRGAGFTTCLAIEIATDGTLVFANAGQLAPYRNGVEIASEAGLPLGIISDLVYPESTLHLVRGDRLTLMTDGIPEAASDHELFGFSRTEELSQLSSGRIAEAAQRFGQTDDITVLSIDFCSEAC
jgi:hypothetical protein